MAPAARRPMWLTELYATRAFRSGWRRHISLAYKAPIRVKEIKWDEMKYLCHLKTDISRRIPYPPSFSKTAAKIIDPATGASTWAFGSHR